ncbi:Serine aminopeptidase, S33 [compost metagenome]|uniref:Alpha/beta superfamily hydrolase n=1 Tax=Variovorax boronicumulans TaxID=436515 RepID=A0AAW8DR37_9BURK|nr:alpha/beta fold hydrolase [Variovorax boronicumulans]MDP9877133.1 alpha/beta superfamily hydrolase [Variovorax boronicumulans]MDP9921990.1 alpha/beta superfamily hydrolase [Variovorax boronicumulans]
MQPKTQAKIARIALSASAAAIGSLAAYWTLLATRQGHILFNARKLPVVHLSDDFSTYSHPVPGGMVRGYVYHPQGEDALQDLFIYFAGRGEDVRATAQMLHWLPEGFGFAALNYRGVADSQGAPSEIASVADAAQFASHLRRAFPQARLHVVGRSLGTGVAIQLVARQEFASLQLITPYDSLLEVAKKRFPLVPLSLLLRHRFNSIEHSKEVAAKTQVLLAAKDDVVPHERSEKLIAAWPTPVSVQTVSNSDHHNITGLEETWLMLVDFALTAVLPETKAA